MKIQKLLVWIRKHFQLVILSDTFYEFSSPLMAKLDFPTILCHTLNINEQGFISNYKLRQQDAKKRAVEGFQAMNFKVLAAGDSHNDIGMLSTADYGFFINAPDLIKKQYPDIQAVNGFDELKRGITQVDSEIGSAEWFIKSFKKWSDLVVNLLVRHAAEFEHVGVVAAGARDSQSPTPIPPFFNKHALNFAEQGLRVTMMC